MIAPWSARRLYVCVEDTTGRGELTSHMASLYSMSECTASIARKDSSMTEVFALEYRILGVMTVARL